MNGTFNRLLDGAPFAPPVGLPQRDTDLVTMIGAKDSTLVPYEGLHVPEVPDVTYRETTGNVSYAPVPHWGFADAVRSIFSEELGMAPMYETYALKDGGNKMFGKIVWPWEGSRGLSIGLNSSYDQSIALRLAGGLDTFVCANGSFSGEAMMKLKHTAGVYDRAPAMIREMAQRAGHTAQVMSDRLDGLAEVPLSDDLFYAYIGILAGHGHINTMIFNSALRYWNASRAAAAGMVGRRSRGGVIEHGAPTLASGYQAVTGGLQLAHPLRVFSAAGGVETVTRAIAASGGSVDTDIPSFDLQEVIEEYE